MKLCLNMDYNGSNSYFYVNDLKIYRLEAEDSGMKPYPLCFYNVTKKVLQSRARKNWFARDVYDMSFLLVIMLLMLVILWIFIKYLMKRYKKINKNNNT